jgi:hypothetical protein
MMAMSCWLVSYLLVSKPLLLIKHTYQGEKKNKIEKDMKREGRGGSIAKVGPSLCVCEVCFFHQTPFNTPSSHS